MFKMKRNQVIITALVVMISVAGYLNYSENKMPKRFTYKDDNYDKSPLVEDKDFVETSGESINKLTNYEIVDKDISIETEYKDAKEEKDIKIKNKKNKDEHKIESKDNKNEQSRTEPGEALFVNSSKDSSYFVQAKLEREQSRSKQREILLDLINNENVDQNVKSDSADAMLNIQKKIEKESAAESMIESKGFSEVFVRIDEDTVDVVVNKENLTDAELAQIEDIIKRKTGIDVDSIRITPMKNHKK